jgi:hypothetical protein
LGGVVELFSKEEVFVLDVKEGRGCGDEAVDVLKALGL